MVYRRTRQGTVEEITRRIVAVADPDRIVLFGSAARGQTGPHSDIDLLVIKGGNYDQSHLLGDIYQNLYGVGRSM